MPSVITIDGLTVDDSRSKSLAFFGKPLGKAGGKKPAPYRFTERVEIKGLKTASGAEPRVSADPDLLEAVKVIR
jgi:hypothetical protein